MLWEDMKIILLKQFWMTQIDFIYEQWVDLKQKNSILEYQCQFIELSALHDREEIASGNWLNLEIWAKIQSWILPPPTIWAGL